jgi:hypothetical protein
LLKKLAQQTRSGEEPHKGDFRGMDTLTVWWDGKEQTVTDLAVANNLVGRDFTLHEDYSEGECIEPLVELYVQKSGTTCYFTDSDGGGYTLLVDGKLQSYDWLDNARDELVALSKNSLEFQFWDESGSRVKERDRYYFTDTAGLEAIDALARRAFSRELAELLNIRWQDCGGSHEEFLYENGCGSVGKIGVYHHCEGEIEAYSVNWQGMTVWVAYNPFENEWFGEDNDWDIEDYSFGAELGSASFWWHIEHCDGDGDVSVEDKIAYLRDRHGITESAGLCAWLGAYEDDDGWWFVNDDAGVVYCCPDTAQKIGDWQEAEWTNDLDFVDAVVYKAPEGHFFAVGRGGARTAFAKPDEMSSNSWTGSSSCLLLDSDTVAEILARRT